MSSYVLGVRMVQTGDGQQPWQVKAGGAIGKLPTRCRRGATPDQTSTDHANGLVSFVVDGDVLLHAYVRMTDMLDGRGCFALDSCG